MCVAEKRAKKRSRQESWPRRVNAICAEKKKSSGGFVKIVSTLASLTQWTGHLLGIYWMIIGTLACKTRRKAINLMKIISKNDSSTQTKQHASIYFFALLVFGRSSPSYFVFRKKIKAGGSSTCQTIKKKSYAIIEIC